jgi:hypothetical protein
MNFAEIKNQRVLNAACAAAASSGVPMNFQCQLPVVLADGGDRGGVGSGPCLGTIQAEGRHVNLPAINWPASAGVSNAGSWTNAVENICRKVPEPTCTGLIHARNPDQKERPRQLPKAFKQRKDEVLHHLLLLASDGRPLSVRTFYDSYRVTFGVTTADLNSQKLRLALRHICNHTEAAIEYLMLLPETAEPVQNFVPNKKRKGQPQQILAGQTAFGDKILYF